MTNAAITTIKRLALLGLAVTLIVASCRDAAAPPRGEALYSQHCASCHGEDGDGNGPLAEYLRRPPSNLRLVSKRNNGQFDDSYVMGIIDGRREVAEHGPREMPVWGAVFEEQYRPEGYPAYTSLLHSRALTDYLRSIQQQ